ncbi:histidine phosphatase family protein [Micropruina sp.]|uniref:histidine phosphatase family protein n=1 Tax=Micropruina sp. TaxID=2737536 RepID=UPI0039E50B15
MKLILVAPGPAATHREAVFGDAGDPLGGVPITIRPEGAVYCAPEVACREAAARTGALPVPLAGLAGPDFGAWHGLALRQVIERDPAGLQDWLHDPTACPHGGESLATHLQRIGSVLDAGEWPVRGATVIASALTVRAAGVHALGAHAESLLHLDVAPGTIARVSLTHGTWRLQSLVPPSRG